MKKKDIYSTEGFTIQLKDFCDVFDEFFIGMLHDLIKAFPCPSLDMEEDKDE